MKRIAIIGAGISGLFIANLLKKNSNYEITIFEKNSSINLDEGYGVQLSVNSIKLLNKIGFQELDDEKKYHPNKVDFYSNEEFEKICDLNISDYNSSDCKYTTIKRSILINFLKKGVDQFIKIKHDIESIVEEKNFIRISFRNKNTFECDCLIISDGVFSKSKSFISNRKNKIRYNQVLAIRGIFSKSLDHFNEKNISLFLGPNFHYVIYPINPNNNFNFIALIKHKLSKDDLKNYFLFNDSHYVQKILDKTPPNLNRVVKKLEDIKIFPVYVSEDFCKLRNNNIHLIGDAFFAFPPSFAQGASQSIEGAYELFKNIENNTQDKFFSNRKKKTKMINNRSKFNQFAFHLSNPVAVFIRNILLKILLKNKKFLESYLGKIYKN